MHDPMTVAHEIRALGITIWHVDPETDGTDDSCRWFQRGRPWWRHPRWHVHHWRIQWSFAQDLKRWLWSRCKYCGKRFPWGYSPTGLWSNTGPRWFKGEENVWHHECRRLESDVSREETYL